VTDPEIKFGYSITGEIDPDRILTNASARVGDVLILTKPLGTGIIVRARRFGHGTDQFLHAAVQSMKRLNDSAAAAARGLAAGEVSACTDVTGFGLAGHACEMAKASGVTLEIVAADLPTLPGALALAQEYLPCGGRANLKFFTGFVTEDTVSPEWHLICQDPQTSGGLADGRFDPAWPLRFTSSWWPRGCRPPSLGRSRGPRPRALRSSVSFSRCRALSRLAGSSRRMV
jgi:selenide,water dikinase